MTQKTYKAAIYKGIGKIDIEELPYPQCGDNDVIVKNRIAGICGGDLAAFNLGGDANMIWEGSEFGHEMTSEVIEVGKNVKDIEIGDHVFPNMGNAKRDYMRTATVGGFSEYVHIPDFEINFSAIKIDRDIPLLSSVLLEPFVIGTKGARRTNPGPGKTGIVFGAGIIGMSSAIMLDWYGCDRVMVVDISDYRLKNAESFGFLVCNPQNEDLAERAKSEFGTKRKFMGEGCGADLYVDALTVDVGVDYFMELASRCAVLSIVGVHHHPKTLDLIKVCYNDLCICGCGDGRYEDVAPDVLEMMKSNKYDLAPLISHQFKQDDILEAFKMANNPAESQKVTIVY
ncbi:MAG: alcohol dehydrogenase catalytic domain-containing protein [Coriobacteriales bacterium]|jgi:threonine dehydrogenase-like Zn-dependent dehydrogenase|nr:alcohol dehydrogenase catalytic domain-containing protein [Coriobacteriales bacterium]